MTLAMALAKVVVMLVAFKEIVNMVVVVAVVAAVKGLVV